MNRQNGTSLYLLSLFVIAFSAANCLVAVFFVLSMFRGVEIKNLPYLSQAREVTNYYKYNYKKKQTMKEKIIYSPCASISLQRIVASDNAIL